MELVNLESDHIMSQRKETIQLPDFFGLLYRSKNIHNNTFVFNKFIYVLKMFEDQFFPGVSVKTK